MEYAENTKITLRSRLANNTRAASVEYTKKKYTKNIGSTEYTEKKHIFSTIH